MPEGFDFDTGYLVAILVVNLPLVVAFGIAQQKGWILFGRQHEAIVKAKDDRIVELDAELTTARAAAAKREAEMRAEFDSRLAYMDDRRKEEREGRISAEKRVTTLTEVTSKLVDLMQDIRVELARVFGPARVPNDS